MVYNSIGGKGRKVVEKKKRKEKKRKNVVENV